MGSLSVQGHEDIAHDVCRIVVVFVASLQYFDNYGPQLSQAGHHAKGNRSSKAMIRHSFRKCHAYS
jgi:hypothetical protein